MSLAGLSRRVTQIWRGLGRTRLAITLLLLTLSCVGLGTLFPQLPSDPSHRPAWWALVERRFGPLYGPLRALGLFDLFSTLWFWALVGLLLLSTLACTLNRLRPLVRAVFRPRVRLPDERFESAASRVTLRFPSSQVVEKRIAATLKRHGYATRWEQEGHRLYFLADRFGLARLGTLLTHTAVLLLALGVALGALLGWREQGVVVHSNQVTWLGHGTGLGLRCQRFEIERYADGSPRAYRAELTLSKGGGEIGAKTVEINHPIHYGGVRLYLTGYRLSQDDACQVTLSAVRDPSFSLVVLAGALLLVGLTVTFGLTPRRLWARVVPVGEAAVEVVLVEWPAREAGWVAALVADLERSE